MHASPVATTTSVKMQGVYGEFLLVSGDFLPGTLYHCVQMGALSTGKSTPIKKPPVIQKELFLFIEKILLVKICSMEIQSLQ